jgi:hypothetical protein
MSLVYGNEFQVLSGDIIQLDDVTRDYRTCPEAVDSCIYVCGEGETNPFNPVTTIQFDIPAETQHPISLQIYDIRGRMVETLVNEKLEPGQHEIQWNASQHSSGVYFLRMNAGTFPQTQKLILLK